MSSIQDYFDAAADSRERPRATSTNTPRHPPSASRTARHASNPGGQRVPARSSREGREHPSSSQAPRSASQPSLPLQAARGPRRSTQTVQHAAPRSSQEAPSRPARDPYILARIDREREEPPPPPYEPLPSRTPFGARQTAPPAAARASLEGMMAGLEVVEPPPIARLQDIRNDDAVIAVMGMTGSGKSTFISHFCSTARGDHGLRSATAQVEAHVASHPIRDRRVIFVDTPGFDDTLRTDTEVLREIVNWLNVTYAQNIKMTGVVYLHGVNVPRVTGSAHTNMRLFRELCGDESMASVVLATTHWSHSPGERAAQELRHEQLVADDAFWRRMERNGACIFKHDRGETSARAIVHYLLERGSQPGSGGMNLRVQREMAEGRTLDQTAVGMALERRMEEMRASYERELGNLKRELGEARRQTAQNQQRIEEINEDRMRLQERLDEEKAYRRQLRKNLKQLQRERSEERRKERKHRQTSRSHGHNKQKECVIM